MALLSWRRARGAALLACFASVVVAAGPSCIRSTPFQSDPSVTNSTAKNLAALREQEPAPRPFKFAAFGDTHTDYDNLQLTIDAINARDDIEFVLIAGDMTNDGLLQEFEWAHEQYDRLDVPFLTVIGNHDALGHGPEIYAEMYGPDDYSFTYGGIKFVLFNSNTLEFGPDIPRRDWLLSEVEDQRDALGVVLVAHHDLTNPDDHPGGTLDVFYEDLVQRPGVSGVIHGHLAKFELLSWKGVPVLQCGTYEHVFLHTIVTIDGAELSFEVCLFDHCEPAIPQPYPELE
jgi:predicted phosphodiesterase